jgi:DNA-binding CsgD family transcriptional regulator
MLTANLPLPAIRQVAMSLDERVSALIKRIYCAGDEAGAWDDIAAELLKLTGGCAALTTLVDLRNRQFDSYRFYGPDDTQFALGVEEYAHTHVEDPSLIWASHRPNARFCDSSKTTTGDYLQNDFVKWNLAHFGSTHWYVGYTRPEDELSFSFSVHFPAAQGPGTPEGLALFHILFDHVECAVRLRRRPFNPDSSRALILVDSGGFVRDMSRRAGELLAEPGALSVTGSRLATTCPAQQLLLDKAMARALNTVTEGTRPQAVQVRRATGRPWIVVIRPLLSSFGPFGQIRCELLLEVHDGLPKIGSIDLLQSLYDLTGREMQLIRFLVDSHSLESAAECMSVSVNTARAHLRAIFAKTGTSRQSELMHLCAGLSHST